MSSCVSSSGPLVSITGSYTAEVEAHGVVALRITPKSSARGHEEWRPWRHSSATAGGKTGARPPHQSVVLQGHDSPDSSSGQ